jgi:type IV fimbrial biogenesis protein FimT
MKKMMLRDSNFVSAFTITELMIVICIIGILSSIAIPNFYAMLQKNKLKSATRDIVSCLQEMKLRAIRENANAVVVFDVKNNSYKAFLDNGAGSDSGNWIHDPSEIIIAQTILPEGINIYKCSFSKDTAGFNSRGFPAGNKIGSIYLKAGDKDFIRIVINFSGNIRVQKSTDGKKWT